MVGLPCDTRTTNVRDSPCVVIEPFAPSSCDNRLDANHRRGDCRELVGGSRGGGGSRVESVGMASQADRQPVRLAELVAALSLGIDLGFGQPMEHVLRQCLIALRLAERLGLGSSRPSLYAEPAVGIQMP